VDIYEGDIIRCKIDFGPGGFNERLIEIPTIIPVTERNWNAVSWERGVEVISNIHEKPNLIEDENKKNNL
jgi:hypothetical protein